MSDSLWPHGLLPISLLCPPPYPRVCSNSCPLSWWCYLTIPSSVAPFSSCPQSFPASGSLLMSWLFTSGSQSIGASASVSVLPMNIQSWFPLGLTDFDHFAFQGNLKSLLQHHMLKASIFWCSASFIVQLSHPYMTMGKNIFNYTDLVNKVRSPLFNMLSNFIIGFLKMMELDRAIGTPGPTRSFYQRETKAQRHHFANKRFI